MKYINKILFSNFVIILVFINRFLFIKLIICCYLPVKFKVKELIFRFKYVVKNSFQSLMDILIYSAISSFSKTYIN